MICLSRMSPVRPRVLASPSHGFTLIEVLVALAIVAIALSAGVQASNALIHNASRQGDTLLAQLCAENELVGMRLSKRFPDVGDQVVSCEQAGRGFGVTLSVFPTPNPSFRRVEAHVRDGTEPSANQLLVVSTVLGKF
jgi:general secretion pathway protein I